MRVLRLLVLAVLAPWVMLVTASAPPAFACSCAYVDTADFVHGADEVFAGTLTKITEPPRTGVVSSTDPVTYSLQVDAVFRGEVGAEAELESARLGASCGLEGMVVDRRYVFFTQVDGGRRTASLCGGTELATPQLERAVERLAGARTTPSSSPDENHRRAEAVQESSSAPGTGTLVLVAAGVAAIVGAGLVLRRRRLLSAGGH